MRTRTRRVVGFLVSACLAVLPLTVLATVGAPAASAAENDQTLSGATSSMWQTNNNVEAIAYSGGVVYAGGTFTSVRPPSVAAGTSEVARTYLAAFNSSTGALVTSFNVTLNGRVDDISINPAGTAMYIVGQFTTVNGQSRQRIASISIPSGTLNTGFQANTTGGAAISVDSSASAVYFSGDFTSVRGVAKSRIASVDPTTGALNTAFTAELSARANAIEIAPDGSRVLVGGNFDTVNGQVTGGMVSLDPTTGALDTWNANSTFPINVNCAGRVTDIIASGTTAYVTGEGDPPGCYEGTYSASISDGTLNWNSTCLGASMGLALLNNVLYKASHQHDCAFNYGDARGGYVGGTSRADFYWWRLVGQNVSDGSFVHWSPNTNSGTGSNPVGPHVLATDGTQMFVGGDFTRVNGAVQQGLARFGSGNGSVPEVPAAPTVHATGVGEATVIWPTVHDRENGTLTYRLYRDGSNTPISTQTVESYPWSRPWVRFDDTGLTPGSTHTYQVLATDGTYTSARSPATSVTIRSAALSSYDDMVRSLGANLYWRLDDTGTTLVDSSTDGTAPGETVGNTTSTTGVLSGNAALGLDGATAYATSAELLTLSSSFTQTAWFRTTSITGGSLLAVTDAKTGIGTVSDRAVTMDNNGNVVFSVHRPPPDDGTENPFGPELNNVRQQNPVFNDGQWHQVVATWSGSVASLYVDGVLLGTYEGTAGGPTSGYQRVGYTDLTEEQAVFGRNFYNQKWPLTEHFNGSIDEVATFSTALTAEEVRTLFAAGVANEGGVAPTNEEPTASFTASMTNLYGSFDASASADPDGSIVSYLWDFGDGTTGSGATATHSYAAAGSYTVALVVTDDDGASTEAVQSVVAEEPSGTPVDSILVANGSSWEWRYAAGAPAAEWNTAGFDATSWNDGNAVLGFGTTVALATNIDTFATTSDRPLAAYFRRTFSLADASTVTALELETVADDGVVVYVNGTEVGRSNMPAGTISTTTYASSARNTTTANASPVTFDVPVGLLVSGTNVIAVETHLNYRATRDLSFDLEGVLTSLQ